MKAIGQSDPRESLVRRAMPWDTGKSYGFRTREGSLGVLTFADSNGDASAIKIGYRLLAARPSGRLQVRLMSYLRNPDLADPLHLPQGHPAGDLLWLERIVWLDERQVTKAEVIPDGAGRYYISLILNPLGSARIRTVTRTREGR
jgi:hypothetical protein